MVLQKLRNLYESLKRSIYSILELCKKGKNKTTSYTNDDQFKLLMCKYNSTENYIKYMHDDIVKTNLNKINHYRA